MMISAPIAYVLAADSTYWVVFQGSIVGETTRIIIPCHPYYRLKITGSLTGGASAT